MMTILLFISSFFVSAGSENAAAIPLCIGEKCSGDKITKTDLEKNFTLVVKDYKVQSFVVSFPIESQQVIYEKSVNGNSLETVVPLITKEWPIGKKIYFDNVELLSAAGEKAKTWGIFIIE